MKKQLKYLVDITRLENEKNVWYFDETSVNLWMPNKRSWTDLDNPVTLPLQSKRGHSKTMLAACGGTPFRVVYSVADRTNTDSVIAFLRTFEDELQGDETPNNTVIVTDNHSSHHSKVTKAYMAARGLSFFFLPAYSSVLK